jgi:hypothetical protein
MAAGFVASIIVFTVGAVLDFAMTASPDQHGFDIHTLGVILMIAGVAGAVVSLGAVLVSRTGGRGHRTTVDDGRGNVIRREDTAI